GPAPAGTPRWRRSARGSFEQPLQPVVHALGELDLSYLRGLLPVEVWRLVAGTELEADTAARTDRANLGLVAQQASPARPRLDTRHVPLRSSPRRAVGVLAPVLHDV